MISPRFKDELDIIDSCAQVLEAHRMHCRNIYGHRWSSRMESLFSEARKKLTYVEDIR